MKRSIDFYEKQLEKELQLIEKHKRNAADLRKLITRQKGEETVAAVNALNLSSPEHASLMKLLKQDKKAFLKALEAVTREKDNDPNEGKEEQKKDEYITEAS